jgi:hypothetical protein
MRNLVYIVLVVAALVFLGLYLLRINTVPPQVKEALETEQGAPVNNMLQISGAVRKKVETANRIADSSMGDAIKGVDK